MKRTTDRGRNRVAAFIRARLHPVRGEIDGPNYGPYIGGDPHNLAQSPSQHEQEQRPSHSVEPGIAESSRRARHWDGYNRNQAHTKRCRRLDSCSTI